MSIAVVLPLDVTTTVEDYRRSLQTFLAQTMLPRALVVLERGITEELDWEIRTTTWPIRGHQGLHIFRPVAKPWDATALHRAGSSVVAEIITSWVPGEEFHRDTLGHLWVESNNGCASVVYAEDKRVWAANRRQWFELGPVGPSPMHVRAGLLRSAYLLRRIGPVRDYTPDPGGPRPRGGSGAGAPHARRRSATGHAALRAPRRPRS